MITKPLPTPYSHKINCDIPPYIPDRHFLDLKSENSPTYLTVLTPHKALKSNTGIAPMSMIESELPVK
jgi:hypothetical protein